jgi:hypothetical protein
VPKRFALAAADIKSIAPGHGSCLATDRITVGHQPVGFMYRDIPDNAYDSGWRFFAGDESQHYLDDPTNFETYDVNTIANYDSEIVPLLDAAARSAFEWDEEKGGFVKAAFPG